MSSIWIDPAKIPLGRLKSTLDTIERIWAIQNAQALNFDIDIAARVNRGLEALRNPEAVASDSRPERPGSHRRAFRLTHGNSQTPSPTTNK